MPDHIHMCISIPPKYSISGVVGYIKGKSAITRSHGILEDGSGTSPERVSGPVATLSRQWDSTKQWCERTSVTKKWRMSDTIR